MEAKLAVLIYPDGHVSPAFLPANDLDLEVRKIQQLLGGNMQICPSMAPNLSFFANEERWTLPEEQKRVNQLATALCDAGTIVGPVLVMGPVGPGGDTLGLTVEQSEIFLDPKGEDIINALIGPAQKIEQEQEEDKMIGFKIIMLVKNDGTKPMPSQRDVTYAVMSLSQNYPLQAIAATEMEDDELPSLNFFIGEDA